jgi:hypothetical protein
MKFKTGLRPGKTMVGVAAEHRDEDPFIACPVVVYRETT